MSELHNLVVDYVIKFVGKSFLQDFQSYFTDLIEKEYERCDKTFQFAISQRKLDLADTEYRVAIEAMLKSCITNGLNAKSMRSGNNLIDFMSTKCFNLSPYRKLKGSKLNSKYKKQWALHNKIIEIREDNDLFKAELLEAYRIEPQEKIFLLLGVHVKKTEEHLLDVTCSIDLPQSNGKSILLSVPFSDFFEKQHDLTIIEDDDDEEKTLLLKLKKTIEHQDSAIKSS